MDWLNQSPEWLNESWVRNAACIVFWLLLAGLFLKFGADGKSRR